VKKLKVDVAISYVCPLFWYQDSEFHEKNANFGREEEKQKFSLGGCPSLLQV